jgi:serine protease Do
VETKKPATEVKVKVQRKGRPVELKVAIGEQPTGEEVVALAEGRYPAERLGLTVQQITPAIAKALGLAKQEGVVVTDVAENGPADKAGIEVNDVILRVGKKQVRNLNDFKAAVEESRKEKEIALFIKRGDEPGGYVDLKL